LRVSLLLWIPLSVCVYFSIAFADVHYTPSVNLSQIREHTVLASHLGHLRVGQSFKQYIAAYEEFATFIELEWGEDGDSIYEGWFGYYDDYRPQPEDPAWAGSGDRL
jgi:hypothetical protein